MTRWVFRSVATGLYLGVDGAPRAAARVIATRDETEWDVRPDREDPSVLRYEQNIPALFVTLTLIQDRGTEWQVGRAIRG